jgi:hypothetical protein
VPAAHHGLQLDLAGQKQEGRQRGPLGRDDTAEIPAEDAKHGILFLAVDLGCGIGQNAERVLA